MNMQHSQVRRARRRAGRKLGFFLHASVFAAVNIGLIAINMGATPDRPWSLFPLVGWGFGLLMHGLAVLGPLHRIHQALVEREIARMPEARSGGH
jgi:hypothetical protein